MPSYDSDSDVEDVKSYTETTTLLGYASKEPTDDKFSQLGGQPTWLDEKSKPSASFAKCKVCDGYLSLLLQLNGDLPEKFPDHERRLYLFTCRKKTCRRKEGSIRCVRASRITKSKAASIQKVETKPVETSQETKPAPNLGNQLFGGTGPSASTNANPFSSGSGASSNPFSASNNPFANTSSLAAKPAQTPDVSTLPETFASKARISESSPAANPAFKSPPAPQPYEPWPETSSFPAPFPGYHLDADYETLDKIQEHEPPQSNTAFDDAEMSGTGGNSAEEAKLYESTMDTTFQKFADRLAQSPDQILRYEYGASPLLYSSTDAVGKKLAPGPSAIPRCPNCGGNRVFELQLTPHAITELEVDEMGMEGMEWGTVIVGVCGKDCVPNATGDGEVGYLEEWVGVQWEELAK